MVALVKPAPGSRTSAGSTIRVVAVRTGLPMETLRAWERRYGFPRPDRRAGSNRRLYSEKDVERLLAIRRAIERGYRVGDLITKSIAELDGLPDIQVPTAPRNVDLVALLARDAVGEVEAELRRAAAALGPRRFVTDVAHPFAVRVGEEWNRGRLEVRHEHMATECLVTQLRRELAAFQDAEGRPRVLLATLPGEPHTLALQMVALFVVTLGAKPRLLGGPTPARDIVACVQATGADVVGLTLTGAADVRQARRDLRALRRALPGRVSIWVGGSGASSLSGEDARVLTTWDAVAEAVADERRGR